MNYVITISRTYGSGGKEIGRMIAKKLGVDYYAREVLTSQLNDDYNDDESVEYSLTVEDDDVINFEAEDAIFNMQTEAIKKLADSTSCVIVGRCADYILKDYENVVKIFITASPRACMRRVMHLYELNPDDAKSLIYTMNKSRGEYYSYHTGQNRDNATNYDLCINVSNMTAEESADTIIAYVKTKLKI